MLYNILLPSIFKYWSISITSRALFFLISYNSIIVNVIPIRQKGTYILSSHYMNGIIASIILNYHPTFIILFIAIFKHTCLRKFAVHPNPTLSIVQLTILSVLMFNENTDMIPSDDSSRLFPGNNYPTEVSTLILVRINFRNKLVLAELEK